MTLALADQLSAWTVLQHPGSKACGYVAALPPQPHDMQSEHILLAHALVYGRDGIDLTGAEFFSHYNGAIWDRADGDPAVTLQRLRADRLLRQDFGFGSTYLAELIMLRERRDPLWYLRDRAEHLRELALKRRIRERLLAQVEQLG